MQVKKTIVKDMTNPDGRTRLLFATEAYGMGADAPDVRRIIHIGQPSSLESKCSFNTTDFLSKNK